MSSLSEEGSIAMHKWPPPGTGRRPIGVPKTLLCAAATVLPLPTEDGSKLEGGGPIFSPGSRTLAAVNCLF